VSHVIPNFLKKEKLKFILFYFFSSESHEHRRESWFGPLISIRWRGAHSSPQNPSRPPSSLFWFCSRPLSCSPFGCRPLPLLLSPKNLQPPSHNPSRRPHLLLSKVQPSPLGSPSSWCKPSIGVWWEEEGRRKGRTQGDLVVIFFIYAAIQLVIRSSMRFGRGAVQNFVGGRKTVVLLLPGDFAWVISGNHCKNHVEVCYIFPKSTYALDSEVYFMRYRILNSPRLLSKN
jgi:hypothetical protein